jgi:hypothetical protein
MPTSLLQGDTQVVRVPTTLEIERAVRAYML